MRKFIVAVLAASALSVVGFAGVAGADPAGPGDGNHGDVVEVAAQCNSDGTQSVTFIISNHSDDHFATIESLSATIGPIEGAQVGDVIPPGGSENATITTSGSQTGTVKLTAELEFYRSSDEDRYREVHGSDDVQFPGGCVATPPTVITVPGPTQTITNTNTVLVPVPGPVQQVEVPGPVQYVASAPVAVVAAGHFTG